MRHLEPEEIAKFVDGNVNDGEREKYLEHFAECEECLQAYTDTLTFFQEAKYGKYKFFPGVLQPLKEFISGLKESIKGLFKKRWLVPTFAALILVLVMLPVVKNKFFNDQTIRAKIQYIEQSISDMENTSGYSFTRTRSPGYAAIRAGFFSEDLELLIESGKNKKLTARIRKMMAGELQHIFPGELPPGLRGPEKLTRGNFNTFFKNLRESLETQSLEELFQFGAFVERNIFVLLAKKSSQKKEVEKCLVIAGKYNLPAGVLRKLKKIKEGTGLKTSEQKKLWMDIKMVF